MNRKKCLKRSYNLVFDRNEIITIVFLSFSLPHFFSEFSFVKSDEFEERGGALNEEIHGM